EMKRRTLRPDPPTDACQHQKDLAEKTTAPHPHQLPRTQAASVCHSGFCCDCQCFPPPCQWLPPSSVASGLVSRTLFSGSPGTTSRETRSKFRRDCSSVYAALPGVNGSRNELPPPREWHAAQRALPLRGAVRIGCTFVLKVS